jgi:hypothetical protein
MKLRILRYQLSLAVAFCCLLSYAYGQAQQASWEKVSDAANWQPRDSQGQVVFKNAMWLFGGWFRSDQAPPRDVWRSENGKDWSLVTNDAPWKHSDFPMAVTFKGKMWMMGGWFNGRLPGHEAGNEVWSSVDGKNWKLETKAPWSPRLAGVVVEFKNRLWLFGGTENYYFGDSTSLKNDIWSSKDGVHWEKEKEHAEWAPRAYHQVVAFNQKLYLMAGGNYTPTYAAHNDVWESENGRDWKRLAEKAPWHERLWFTSVTYRGHLWVLGGWSNNPSKNWDDAWFTKDGITWTKFESPKMWKERHAHFTLVFKDKIWVAGGMTPPLVNDIWSLSLPKKWKPTH